MTFTPASFRLFLTALTALLWTSTASATELPAEQIEFFEAKIRPVLIEHCYECHNSLDAAEGGLAVDFRAAILKGGDGGTIIEPGKPEASRLLPILRHEVEGLEMPSSGPKLSDEIIADFEKWISLGAPDPRSEKPTAESLAEATSWEAVRERRRQWWSFQPIATPEVPAVQNEGWSAHPVDRFILQKLEAKGLEPAPLAEPTVLVRRLFFTLIGLPPTPDEVEYWTGRLADASPAERDAATGELIDELLARPAFGERWARHWMDWIRYAESHGSEGDPAIPGAWRYRDYLIRALNADVPYDQLVREHIAGDLLEEPRINKELAINESAIGPAHWRMVFHGFSPTDALDERVRFTDDQINVFSKAFLGLTVSCARCHDHKFDPISQADYYALFGILSSCRPGRTVIDLPEQRQAVRNQLDELKSQIQQSLASEWSDSLENLKERLQAGKKPDGQNALLSPWFDLQSAKTPEEFASRWQNLKTKHALKPESPQSGLAAWDLSRKDDYEQWFPGTDTLPEQPQPAGSFAIATSGNEILKGIYPGGVYSHLHSDREAARLTSPDIGLTEKHQLWVRARGEGSSTVRFAVQNYPRRGNLFPVQEIKSDWTWHRFDLSYWTGDSVHVELVTALDAPLLVKNEQRSWFAVQEVRVLPVDAPAPTTPAIWLSPLFEAAESAPKSIQDLASLYEKAISTAIRDWQNGSLTDSQAELLDRCLSSGLLRNQADESASLKSLVDQYRQLEQQLKTPTRVPGLDETEGKNQALYVRGNHKQPAEVIPRRFLEVIDSAPYDTELSGRRQLAEDVLRDDNPLTRRVIANRLWVHLFGHGLVGTPDNFGRLGQEPSHPELLDWLAVEMSDRNWSLKEMIRLLVSSKTWQLSSTPGKLAMAADPDNTWLSHAHVRRLEAEAIRDSMLSASGTLQDQLYGPPVGGNAPRRSVYVQVIRNRLDPFLRSFDFPEPFSATGRRSATNVPAQSLMLMNDSQIRAAARNWSNQVLKENGATAEDRIHQMFLTAFGRQATSDEIARIETFLQSSTATREQLRDQYDQKQQELAGYQTAIQNILGPVRHQLEIAHGGLDTSIARTVVQPLARWDFVDGLEEGIHQLATKSHGDVKVADEALIVKRGGYVTTDPLPWTIREKTLEAWVQLDDFNQRGAGVITLQSPNGRYFDSLVFGERAPEEWLAGSDHGVRSQIFQGPAEKDAVNRPVHVAIAYHADGTIRAYRDGEPYGNAYKSNGPFEFKAGECIVSFGVRHLPAGGNRMLSGRILRARLYDQALSAEQVLGSFRAAPTAITESEVREALTAAQRNELQQLETKISQLEKTLEQMGPAPETGEAAAWADLAQALFTFQEFIYLR